jgi:HTH-type transcriptional regulator / antitoxin HigA
MHGSLMKVASPGSLVRELLSEADWSQTDLAHIIGTTPATVNQIVNDKRPITAELAKLLGVAFRRPAEEFADRQARWNLALAPEPSDEVKSRAIARARFPIRAMMKRGWIAANGEDQSLHGELCRFFGVNDLDGIGKIGFAAKKGNDGELTGEQTAWLYRVKRIAEEMVPEPFSPEKLQDAVTSFADLRSKADGVRFVPRLLNQAGVRFVVCEALPGSNIDGVCFWLDRQSPVIGLSMRYDRIDNFWFVLRHECAHVLYGHGKDDAIIDADLDGDVAASVNEEERIANEDAADFCVSARELNSFYLRKRPFFADREVQAFAKRMGVHPGLVVGQLQRRMGRYDFLRKHLVKVRENLGSAMMMDGWGDLVPVG